MPALAEAYIQDGLICLGLPTQTSTAFQFTGDQQAMRDAEVVRKVMLNLVNAEQVSRAQAIIDQYRLIQFDTETIKAEGLDSSPYRARKRLADMLQNAIGWAPRGGGTTIIIERA